MKLKPIAYYTLFLVSVSTLLGQNSIEELIEEKRWTEATQMLEAALQENPEDPQLYVRSAEIFAGQGLFLYAAITLDQAIQRDPSLEKELAPIRSVYANLSRLSQPEPVPESSEEEPESEAPKIESPSKSGFNKRRSGYIGLGLGYGSNLNAINNDIPLAAGTEDADSGFIDAMAGLNYLTHRKENWGNVLSAHLSARNHFDASHLDTDSLRLENKLSIQDGSLMHSIKLGARFQWFDSEYYNQEFSTSYQLARRLSNGQQVGFIASLAHSDYQTLVGATDRDGLRPGVSVFWGGKLNDKVQLSLSGTIDYQDTDGNEYENVSVSFAPAAYFELPYQISGALFGTYQSTSYANDSIFLELSEERDDDRFQAGVRLSRKFADNWTLSGSYTYNDSDSNVSLFGYTQHIFATQLILSF